MADITDPFKDLKDVVKVVGDANYQYIDRKTLLKSDFLKKIYNSNRRICPRGFRQITLSCFDDHDWRMTTTYFEYLRTGTLTCASWDFSDLMALHHVGRAVEDISFQDTLMDALLMKYKEFRVTNPTWLPDKEIISTAYADTLHGSPLRTLLVDIHIWSNDAGPEDSDQSDSEEDDEDDRKIVPKAFWKELIEAKMAKDDVDLSSFARVLMSNGAKATLQTAPTVDLEADNSSDHPAIPSNVSACDYHLHEPGALCAHRKRKRAAEESLTQPLSKHQNGRGETTERRHRS